MKCGEITVVKNFQFSNWSTAKLLFISYKHVFENKEEIKCIV